MPCATRRVLCATTTGPLLATPPFAGGAPRATAASGGGSRKRLSFPRYNCQTVVGSFFSSTVAAALKPYLAQLCAQDASSGQGAKTPAAARVAAATTNGCVLSNKPHIQPHAVVPRNGFITSDEVAILNWQLRPGATPVATLPLEAQPDAMALFSALDLVFATDPANDASALPCITDLRWFFNRHISHVNLVTGAGFFKSARVLPLLLHLRWLHTSGILVHAPNRTTHQRQVWISASDVARCAIALRPGAVGRTACVIPGDMSLEQYFHISQCAVDTTAAREALVRMCAHPISHLDMIVDECSA